MSYTKRGPFVNASPTGPWVDADFFNNVEAALTAALAQGVSCPPPTGVAATDTANIQAAITTAQATSQNLYLPPTNGVFYKMNTGITWDLTRGSIIGAGTDIDFGNLTGGVALTITGPGNSSNGAYTSHRSTVNRITSLNIQGYSSAHVNGVLFDDPFAVDGATLTHTTINGFYDGITFGNNVWLVKCEKVVSMHHSRYAVNMTVAGNNSGENIAFYDCCFSAVGTGAASVYSPANNNTEVRFVACSFDYATTEGIIEGGNLTFEACHIEDRSSGPMFTYTNSGGGAVNVTFRDCSWDSSITTGRDHLHEVLTGATGAITINFDGVGGGVGSQHQYWILDNSGIAAITVRNWAMTTSTSTNMNIGAAASVNILTNGGFDDSSTFVATPGIRGWYAGNAAFTYSPSNNGNGLRIATSTAVTGQTTQRVRIDASRRPIRIAGRMTTTAYTSGAIGIYAQFYGEDGTTAVGGQIRIGSDLAALTGGANSQYVHNSARLIPLPGAAYLTVILNAASFIGTCYWEDIEAVPV